MIKPVLHKIFSISLALLVLISTVSFTVEKHFCGDTLVDVAVFSEAEKCSMEALELAMEKITKKPCCKDTVDLIEGQDELQLKAFDDLDYDQQVFVTSFVYSYENLYEALPRKVVSHRDYSPPNLIFDINIRDQVFLI